MPPKSKMSNNYTRELERQIKASNHVVVVLDDDGTLAPAQLGATPPEIAPSIKELLTTLAENEHVTVVIMSGRSLLDLKKNFPVKGVILAANHGLEIEGDGLVMHHKLAEKSRQVIHHAANTLRIQLSRIDGTQVDDRGLSALLNFRLVREDETSSLMAKARNLLGRYVREREIKLVQGKKILELMPPVEWSRGKAVRAIVHELRRRMPDQRVVALYFGDDKIDEDGFKYVNQIGMAWRVGLDRTSFARYYLKAQEEIAKPLRIIRDTLPKLGTKQVEDQQPTEKPMTSPAEKPLVPLEEGAEKKPADDSGQPKEKPKTITLDDLFGDDDEPDMQSLPSGTKIVL